jgi:hypothetical protein
MKRRWSTGREVRSAYCRLSLRERTCFRWQRKAVAVVSVYLAVALLLTAAQLPAQEPPAADKERIEAALKLTTAEAAKYSFVLEDANRPDPELVAEPVLKWSNPAAGEIHGNVFLWTSRGRPVVVGALFKWFTPHTHMSHEFHSLAETPLAGRYDQREVWKSSEAGVTFAPLAAAPPPAETPAQRLIQMRRLARELTAIKRDREGSVGELRLLTQPVYRYADPAGGVIDGALFAFVQGTDPEVFVLFEARSEGGTPRWTFAAARMNSVAFTLRHGEREVWKVDVLPWADVQSHRQVYTTFRHDAVLE